MKLLDKHHQHPDDSGTEFCHTGQYKYTTHVICKVVNIQKSSLYTTLLSQHCIMRVAVL
ncbi:hypothetical protein DCAR_0207906 [Daucus carota subsp. sativus]|uniref:Uncharacterized protein n=1 Tax=Daucus carota subsp. sativus TaxID=79200 RepID=A0A161X5F9_DAUCS|nr:hypothetical protein DCAR_0207906 [Daucus carota subsp. sativus]